MNKSNILIVDDDLVNLLVLEKMLKNQDLNITKAGSGIEALELIEKTNFALILLDAQMPELNGFETAKKIRSSKKHRDLPIIILSAVSKTKEFILKGYEAGAVDYLLKPIDQFLLMSKVNVFCELHKQKELLEGKNSELNKLNVKLHEEISKQEKIKQKLLFQAIRDPLTGLFNRRYLEESLEREISKAKRQKIPLGLIMLDADHFKDFNDVYGHIAGDIVLKHLSTLLVKNSRKEDIACRFGGEEFVLVLPGTDEIVAKKRAEDLRLIVETGKPILHGKKELPNITISLGIALLPEHGKTAIGLVTAADQALYQAKREGRNRVVVASTGKK
ncbi:MAG: diguanylate cyclase [Deltaproteobacteria bacterium]|nr:diguanylate cyclase [Deltaproteobacteria bacterium]